MSSFILAKEAKKESSFQPHQWFAGAARAVHKKSYYNRRVATAENSRGLKELAVRQSTIDEHDRIAKMAIRVRIAESFSGVVAHVGNDEVVVVFDVNNDLVEHVYHRSQFTDKLLPKEGQRLTVTVRVTDSVGTSMSSLDQQREDANVGRSNSREYCTGNAEF